MGQSTILVVSYKVRRSRHRVENPPHKAVNYAFDTRKLSYEMLSDVKKYTSFLAGHFWGSRKLSYGSASDPKNLLTKL